MTNLKDRRLVEGGCGVWVCVIGNIVRKLKPYVPMVMVMEVKIMDTFPAPLYLPRIREGRGELVLQERPKVNLAGGKL